ncbi:MAG: redoxin domain-containing protein, partial [Actinomycetota bacterium]
MTNFRWATSAPKSFQPGNPRFAWINTPRSNGGLGEIRYPLLADVNKDAARAYQVLTDGGVALRGLFLINPQGKIAYQVVHDLGVGRSVDETL